MTMQNRDAFLDGVAANLGRSRLREGVDKPVWSVAPQNEVLTGMSKDELIDVLEQQCDVIHTAFKRANKAGLAKVLREVIAAYDGSVIVASNDGRNKECHLDEFYRELEAEGKELHLWDQTKGKKNQMFAERADVGITFSDMTLAESGTVTLFNNKYNGRSISLMPRTYIAIIPKSTVVPRMTQATSEIHEKNKIGKKVPSCISFITGPSNSADIEMNLIVGVHGPVKATYIVVDDY